MADGNFYSIPVMEAEKDRNLDFVNNSMKNGLPAPAIPAVAPAPKATAPQVTSPDSNVAGLAKAVGAAISTPKPAAPAPATSGFQAFNQALQDQSPFRNKVQSKIESNMDGQNAANLADQQATQARTQMGRNVQSESEARRQQAIKLGLGGNQLATTQNLFQDQALVAGQDLEGQLAANKTQSVMSEQQQAIQDALRLREAGTEEAKVLGGLQQSELESQRNLTMSEKELSVQQLMQDKSLTWDEKRLSIEQKFAGDEAGKARAFQSLEAEKDRENQNKMLDKNLTWEERKQASDQLFASREANLNRTLDTLLTDKRIAADISLKTMDQAFTEKITKEGWMNEKDMFDLKSELEKELQARGIKADEAKQIADQNFQLLSQKNDQAFEEKLNDTKQNFLTGERIATEDWQANQSNLDRRQQETMAKLDQEMEGLSIDKRAAAEKTLQTYLKEKDYLISKSMLGDKTAVDKEIMALDNKYAKDLQNNGLTNDKALLALKHTNDIAMQDDEQFHLTNMALAQRASEDAKWADEMGLKREVLDARKKQITEELRIAGERLGLDKKQMELLQSDNEFARAMEIASVGLELAGDDPAAMAPFVDMMAQAAKKGATGLGLDTTAFTNYARDLQARENATTAVAKLEQAKTVKDMVEILKGTGMSEEEAYIASGIPKGTYDVYKGNLEGLSGLSASTELKDKARQSINTKTPDLGLGSTAGAATKTDARGNTTGTYNGKSFDKLEKTDYADLAKNKKALDKFVEDGIIPQSTAGDGYNLDNPTKRPQDYIGILNQKGIAKDSYDLINNEDIQFKRGKEPLIRTEDGQLVKIVKYVSRGEGSDRHGSVVGFNVSTGKYYMTGRGAKDVENFIKNYQAGG